MKLKNAIYKVCLAAVFITVSMAAFAAPPKEGGRKQWLEEMRQYKRTFFTRALDLSHEQQNKFFPIYEEMDEQCRKIDDDTRVMEKRLSKADDVTDVEYEKAVEAMYDAKLRQAEIEKEYMAKYKPVLSKKQLFKLKGVERAFQRDILKQHRRLHHDKKRGPAKTENK